jgi:two-component system, chemotaxis family, sensor kinase CheA
LSSNGGKIDVQRFLQLFLEEAVEHLGTLERGLLRLEEAPDDRSVIDDVFRAAHSLKGGSSTFGLQQVGRLTHAMESLLERARTGACVITPGLTSLLLRATDELRIMLASPDDGSPMAAGPLQVMADLEKALGTTAAGAASATARTEARVEGARVDAPVDYQIRFRPDPNIYQTGGDPLLVLRDLADAGEILDTQLDLTQLPDLAALDAGQSYLAWEIRLRSQQTPAQLREVFSFIEDGSQIEITALAPAAATATGASAGASPEPEARAEVGEAATTRATKAADATIRVAIDKVDKLINLVGELVIAQSMISQVLKNFTPASLPRLQESVGEMERNIRDLQGRVMSVRMVPLSTVFARMPRVVRDLAGALDKKIAVQVTGGETEIDKSVIERIGDPLTHLIRNAVDHGIETPAERLAAGKPEQGQVKLSAFHQGGNVVIHIQDDGRGLDTAKIRKKAIAQGLIKPDEELSSEALHAFIFRAGFSTAEKVTDVSGRGVGMDVVRTNIESLNGTITLDSEKGKGACFSISLPLTLAIIDGLCVGVGDEVYVVPLVSIIESFRPGPDDIKTIGGRGEVVCVRGKVLPLVRLRKLLAVPTRAAVPTTPPIIVIIESQGATVGLVVDETQGQAQVVIKSLETNYRRIEGVMGATIMGDGRVALILDVQSLTRIGHRPRGQANAVQAEA